MGPVRPPAEALGSLRVNFCPAYFWDAATGRWRIHIPGAKPASDLDVLRPCTVYWLMTARDVTIPFDQ